MVTTMSIAQRLTAFRQAAELSRQEVADAIGVNASTVYRLETGELTLSADRALELAKMYRVSIGALLGEQRRYGRSDV